ncbi:MAG: radical SAM protein, partial [SAR202 cluster bacterium]|nr:radical SAM protein [SAR202 cluster bacterium]
IYQPNLDKLRLGLQKYAGNGELIHEIFSPVGSGMINLEQLKKLKLFEKNKNIKKVAHLYASRGCVARCTFCQRGSKGYRVYAHSELENHIIELKEKYNVGVIDFWDENFGSNRKQTYEMARILKKHDIFWAALGRCTNFTYEDLKFYKEHNIIWLGFGVESGSQKMLDIMEKKFTTKDVYNAISNCAKLGIATSQDAMMIGMPGETRETIIESAQFVASLKYLLGLGWNNNNPFMTIAIPGTPLYEYCQQIGIIGKTLDEEEDYLIRSSEHGFTPILNYLNKTDSSIKEVHYWKYLYVYAGKKAYVDLIIKNNKSIKNMLLQIYERCIKGSFND